MLPWNMFFSNATKMLFCLFSVYGGWRRNIRNENLGFSTPSLDSTRGWWEEVLVYGPPEVAAVLRSTLCIGPGLLSVITSQTTIGWGSRCPRNFIQFIFLQMQPLQFTSHFTLNYVFCKNSAQWKKKFLKLFLTIFKVKRLKPSIDHL